MADVKDINKYYPPDFDPQAFHRNKHLLKQNARKGRKKTRGADKGPGGGPPEKKMEIRMLWPFSLVCDGCEGVIFVGTKFNSRVAKVRNETYLGVAIWRIYGRCLDCRNEIVLKTDPKNTDYIIEHGGHRLFDAALAKREAEEEKQESLEKQSKLNQIEQLEMKALNTAQEVGDLETLEKLKKMSRVLLTDTANLHEELLSIVQADEGEGEDRRRGVHEMEEGLKQFRREKEKHMFLEAGEKGTSGDEVLCKPSALRTTLIKRDQTGAGSALRHMSAAYDDDTSSDDHDDTG